MVNILLLKWRKELVLEFGKKKDLFFSTCQLDPLFSTEMKDYLYNSILFLLDQISQINFPIEVNNQFGKEKINYYFPLEELMTTTNLQDQIQSSIVNSLQILTIESQMSICQLFQTLLNQIEDLLKLTNIDLVKKVRPGTQIGFGEMNRINLIQFITNLYFDRFEDQISLLLFKIVSRIICLKHNVPLSLSQTFIQNETILQNDKFMESFTASVFSLIKQIPLIGYTRLLKTDILKFLNEKAQKDFHIDKEITAQEHQESVIIVNGLDLLIKEAFPGNEFSNYQMELMMNESKTFIYHIFFTLDNLAITSAVFIQESIVQDPFKYTLQNVATLASYRKQGLSSKIISQIIEENKDKTFYLDVVMDELVKWKTLLKFYYKFCFVPSNFIFEETRLKYVIELVSIPSPKRDSIKKKKTFVQTAIESNEIVSKLNMLDIFLCEKSNFKNLFKFREQNDKDFDYISILVDKILNNIDKYSSMYMPSRMLKFDCEGKNGDQAKFGVLTIQNTVFQNFNLDGICEGESLYKFYANLNNSLSTNYFLFFNDETKLAYNITIRHMYMFFDHFFLQDKKFSIQNIIDTLRFGMRDQTYVCVYFCPYVLDNVFNNMLDCLIASLETQNLRVVAIEETYNTYCDDSKSKKYNNLIKICLEENWNMEDRGLETLRENLQQARMISNQNYLNNNRCEFTLHFDPEDLIWIKNNLLSSNIEHSGYWELVKGSDKDIYLKNRHDYEGESHSADSFSDKLVVYHTHPYGVYNRGSVGDFIVQSISSQDSFAFLTNMILHSTILPILISAEGVYFTLMNPDFFIYIDTVKEDCFNVIRNLVSSKFSTFEQATFHAKLQNVRWLNEAVKSKIKILYETYGLNSSFSKFIYANKDIRDGIINGYESFANSLTVKSLIDEMSPEEKLAYDQVCHNIANLDTQIFVSKVYSWEEIESYNKSKEYISLQVQNITAECPPFDREERVIQKETKIKRKTKFVPIVKSLDELPYVQATFENNIGPTLRLTPSEKMRVTPQVEDVYMEFEEEDVRLTPSEPMRESPQIPKFIPPEKRVETPSTDIPVVKEEISAEELVQQILQEEFKKEVEEEIKAQLEKKEEEFLEEKNEEIGEMLKNEIPNKLTQEEIKEIEDASLQIEKEKYATAVFDDITMIIGERFYKPVGDKTLEANRESLEMIRNLTPEEIGEVYTSENEIDDELLSYEEYIKLIQDVKTRFVYRNEVFSICHSIFRDKCYNPEDLVMTLRALREIPANLIMESITSYDQAFIREDEMWSFIEDARESYTRFLKNFIINSEKLYYEEIRELLDEIVEYEFGTAPTLKSLFSPIGIDYEKEVGERKQQLKEFGERYKSERFA